MDKITFSGSFGKISDPEVGVRRRHVVEAIESPDKVQTVASDERKFILFTKRIGIAKVPYILVISAMEEKNRLSICHAYKVYPTLVLDIEDKNPIELLEHLANQFGLEFSICGSEYKKFFFKERIPISNLSLRSGISIQVNNPDNHKTITETIIKEESGPPKIINCSWGFCIDVEIYTRWMKSKGEKSYFNEEVLRVQQFTYDEIAPSVSGKLFREKIFTIIHDFCFYCRQHPESLNTLQ